ncbi:Clavaminate synthase-like protein [Sistotremastrum niveocremeum HHB9708]|uniref:Clavaminate synthase-like protein n=1 Tax=Sistotremastrum niveocremeum HHB9708 TaxID=1314777 RepID=A0A164UEJ5_9AGAM|nr:Clavaminate synthase-like protein [Sistotremastrum niveocremeum HHB9708]
METTLPIINLDLFLSEDQTSPDVVQECKKAADALIVYGALLVQDSRVSEDDNDRFLDLLEDYFAQSETELKKDERPELGYQIGVTLENTEKPKCAVDEPCLRIIERLAPEERPLDITAHNPDPKCRFFWKMNRVTPPYKTEYPNLNAPNVVPNEFKDTWEATLEAWGNMMKNSVSSLAEMAALGLDLPRTTFTDAGRYGPHLLAPTASDLTKYGKQDTILAGFHSDLNFLTIHGRSRYPGLHIWARNTGKKIAVKFPPRSAGRFLLVQAGKQLEHISGGLIRAGFHEVVVNASTVQTLNERKAIYAHRPSIRISSTFFWHLSSDYDLKPIPSLAERAKAYHNNQLGQEDDQHVYEPMKVGEQVLRELRHIALLA